MYPDLIFIQLFSHCYYYWQGSFSDYFISIKHLALYKEHFTSVQELLHFSSFLFLRGIHPVKLGKHQQGLHSGTWGSIQCWELKFKALHILDMCSYITYIISPASPFKQSHHRFKMNVNPIQKKNTMYIKIIIMHTYTWNHKYTY